MPYKVHFVGLVCFYREHGSRQLLLPDGRDPGSGIDPHYPTILVDPNAVEASSGWPSDASTERGIYALPPSGISIEGADTAGVLDYSQHEGHLPQLRQIDPNFEIDPERAQAVVRLYVRQGTLSAHAVPHGDAVMSQLVVPHDGSITITVNPTDGSPARTLRVNAGTEILVGNMAARGVYDPDQQHTGHFKIYERLSVRPVTLPDPDAVTQGEKSAALPRLESDHWLFRRAGPFNLSVSCSNTGCC